MAYKSTDYTDSKYREYQQRLLALIPINTNEKSEAYRALWKEFYGWNKKSVKELDLCHCVDHSQVSSSINGA